MLVHHVTFCNLISSVSYIFCVQSVEFYFGHTYFSTSPAFGSWYFGCSLLWICSLLLNCCHGVDCFPLHPISLVSNKHLVTLAASCQGLHLRPAPLIVFFGTYLTPCGQAFLSVTTSLSLWFVHCLPLFDNSTKQKQGNRQKRQWASTCNMAMWHLKEQFCFHCS